MPVVSPEVDQFNSSGPKEWLSRPGVEADCLLKRVTHIQRAWRSSRGRLRLLAAKRQLEGGYKDSFVERAAGHGGPPSNPAHIVANTIPAGAGSCTGTRTHGVAPLGSEDPEAAWDQAIAHRQPSVDQVMSSQNRWFQESDSEKSKSLLEILSGDAAKALLRRLRNVECRFQLRANGDASSPWRPPCAVGTAACDEIEMELEACRAEARTAVCTDLDLILLPCFTLFEVIIASSVLYRRKLGAAHRMLAATEWNLRCAPPGSFAAWVSKQLASRASLHLARLQVLEGQAGLAVLTARSAIEVMVKRDGPRSFWPAHSWELAACHRTVALGLAGLGRYGEGLTELVEAERQLTAPCVSSAIAVEPQILSCLRDDIRVLKLEFNVALRVDGSDVAYARVIQEDIGTPAAIQAVLEAANKLLAELSERELLPEVRSPHALARVRAVGTKLALLQELPWFVAGCGRIEALEAAMEQLASSSRMLSKAARLQKITPVEVAHAAICGDATSALESASAWLQECSKVFGRTDSFTEQVNQVNSELLSELETTLTPADSKRKRPRQAFQNVMRATLACTVAGLREECCD